MGWGFAMSDEVVARMVIGSAVAEGYKVLCEELDSLRNNENIAEDTIFAYLKVFYPEAHEVYIDWLWEGDE